MQNLSNSHISKKLNIKYLKPKKWETEQSKIEINMLNWDYKIKKIIEKKKHQMYPIFLMVFMIRFIC